MPKNLMLLAQDKSLRSYDADGRLHLTKSNISKAAVNPYYGKEIPGWQELGLEADKVYQLLRDPEELKKATPSFINLPILIEHVPVSAEKPRADLVIGSTGSDPEFDGEFLNNSLSFWDGKAIALIENEVQKELSSAYRYTPDMSAGTFKGSPYDGVMRDIVGNHVALVDVGRAGSDVVVADKDPFSKQGDVLMKNKTKLSAQLRLALDKANTKKPVFAKDADLDAIVDILAAAVNSGEATDEDTPAEPTAIDNDGLLKFLEGKLSTEDLAAARELMTSAADEGDESKAKDEGDEPDVKKAEDEGEEDKPITKAAMDKAMAAAVKSAAATARHDALALVQAREDVKSLVGFVAMDSAEAVYKFALDKAGVQTKGVDASAYCPMVKLLKQAGEKAKGSVNVVAMDSAASGAMLDAMPNLKSRINGGA